MSSYVLAFTMGTTMAMETFNTTFNYYEVIYVLKRESYMYKHVSDSYPLILGTRVAFGSNTSMLIETPKVRYPKMINQNS